jgi:hypothetical protein
MLCHWSKASCAHPTPPLPTRIRGFVCAQVGQHRSCIAQQTVEAYNKIKSVTLVGNTMRHSSEASVIASKELRRWVLVATRLAVAVS